MQAVDRCYRIGQTKPVVVYRMIAAGTVEEKMYEKQVFKDGIKRSVLDEGGGKSTQRYFEANELRKLFTLGKRGECGVMAKIDSYGIPFDTSAHNYILQHGCVVGLSQHDVFYKLAKGIEPPAELPKPVVMGRSQRILQTKANPEVVVCDGSLVRLGSEPRIPKKQTFVHKKFQPKQRQEKADRSVVQDGADCVIVLGSSGDENVDENH